MSAKYDKLGQLIGKFGVPARQYLTARDILVGILLSEVNKVETACPLSPSFLGKNVQP